METTYTDSSNLRQADIQMDVQRCVREASKIIAPYWPLSSFIANNALGDLEHLPFHQAVQYARALRGGQGFLPLARYRAFFAQQRITVQDISSALAALQETLSLPNHIQLNDQTMLTQAVYTAWLLQEEDVEEVKRRQFELWQMVSNSLQATDQDQSEDIERDDDGQAITTIVNKHMTLWCAAFLDEGQASWAMPGRERGFYSCWKELAGEAGAFGFSGGRELRERIRSLPHEASAALELCLQGLSQYRLPHAESGSLQGGHGQMSLSVFATVNPSDEAYLSTPDMQRSFWTAYLSRHLAQLPGWASIIRWREEHPHSLWQQRYPITLIDYLAVRLFYELQLRDARHKQSQRSARSWTQRFRARREEAKREREATQRKEEVITRLVVLAESLHLSVQEIAHLSAAQLSQLVQLARSWSVEKQQFLWQQAYEFHYRDQLLTALQSREPLPSVTQKASAQALFCIDVRSEGLRRQFEALGPYETYGVAGFFGVPMLYQPFGSSGSIALAPALISPTSLVREVPEASAQEIAKRRLTGNALVHGWHELIHSLREHLLTPFAFVEMAGGFSLFPLLGKTLSPGLWKQAQSKVRGKLLPAVPTEPSILTDFSVPGMSREEQARMVGNMLRSIGLTDHFARIVLLCGHGSETENNPYASALDCGACGGNAGGTSATVTASILNSAAIRALLAEQGLVIPEETFFLAGEHNTTTDTVRFLNENQVPGDHMADLQQLKQDLARAGRSNATTRLQSLPDATTERRDVLQHVQQRASDWAQVRPEWGLARNAAFVCGRRSLTAGLNLESRVFLHSYDQSQDPDGSILEAIMTAPLIVGEWINMQYYFSTVDNQAFGSSTKLLHTVVGQIGVMQGRQSDLLIGLPQQSVMYGDNLFHEPLRLLAIVEASPERIAAILARHEQLHNLVKNQWISLIAYDSDTAIAYEFTSAASWHALSR